MKKISLAPDTKFHVDDLNSVLASGRLSEGEATKKFENGIQRLLDVKHAIATSSGSSADLVAMLALKAMHPERDEVIVPALTFIAQVNAIHMAGLKPVYVDVVSETMQMSSLQTDDKVDQNTLCVFPVHLLGKFSPAAGVDFKVPVIEDACESFCGWERVRPLGAWGLAGTFSFYPSHLVTCGEGGAIVTDDDEFASLCRAIKNHGRLSNHPLKRFSFPIQGTNAKITDMAAGIAHISLHSALSAVQKRSQAMHLLNSLLNQNWNAASPHAYPVFCESKEQRDSAVVDLCSKGIESRCMFGCVPTDEWCKTHDRGSFPNAEHLADTVLYVPCHQDLTESDIEEIASAVRESLNR